MAIQADTHSITKPRKRTARPAGLPVQLRDKTVISHVMAPVKDPAAYSMQADGNCLAPTIKNDDHIVVSPAAKLRNGMIAVIWFVDGRQPIVKRLVTVPPAGGFKPAHPGDEISRVLIVEMDNPPKQFFIPAAKISVVQAVVGIVREKTWLPLNAGVV